MNAGFESVSMHAANESALSKTQTPASVAFGIFAWNEEASIGLTIDSLFQQSVFQNKTDILTTADVYIIANACTDRTVPNAEQALQRNLQILNSPRVSGKVIHIEERGKTNAWNQFVHRLSPRDADILFFLDADITIHGADTLLHLCRELENNQQAYIASAHAIKDVELSERSGLFSKIAMQQTAMRRKARLFAVSGGLYAARTSFVRRWEFPRGWVSGDDACLGYMAITDFLSEAECRFERVVTPPDSAFVFESYSNVGKLFRQHRRRKIGSTIRQEMERFLRQEMANDESNADAGQLAKQKNQEEPEWLAELIEKRCTQRRFWFEDFNPQTRFKQLGNRSWLDKLRLMPATVCATVWDAAVAIAARKMLRSGKSGSSWENNPNKRLVDGSHA